MCRKSLVAGLFGLCGFLLGYPAQALGHDLGVVRVRLLEEAPAQYALEVRLPAIPEFATQVPSLPARCRVSDSPEALPRQAGIDMRLVFDCGGARLTDADVIRLPWPNHGAFVSADLGTGSTAGRFFEATEQGATIALNTLTAGEDR